MAPSISLTDGVTTLALNTGSYLTLDYRFGLPDLEAETITDSIDLLVSGATQAAVQTNVRAIEAMLSQIRAWQRQRAGAQVRLSVQWDGQPDTWDAVVLDAALDAPETAQKQWRKAVEVTLAVTRRPFEGAWVALTLTNRNGTNVTSPLTVNNQNDSDSDNYADVDAAEITGGLPALVKWQLTNTGSAEGWSHWWLAAESHSGKVWNHTIEGESRVAGYGSSVSNAAYSGGAYLSQTVNGSAETHWNLTAAQAAAAGGHPFRILLAFAGTRPEAWVRPAIYDATGLVELARGDEVWVGTGAAGGDVQDAGLLSIPPGSVGANAGALRLVLKWRTLTSQTVMLDFIHAVPGYAARQVIQRGMLILTGESFVLDESEERAYFTEAGAQHPVFVLRGAPVTLPPNKAARLSLLVANGSGDFDPADLWAMQAWAKPRRWTL